MVIFIAVVVTCHQHLFCMQQITLCCGPFFGGGGTDTLIFFLLDPSRFLGAEGLILRNQTCVVLS